MIKLTYQYNLVLIFLLLLIKVTHNKYKAQSIEDLDSISLQQQDKKWKFVANIQHQTIKINAQFEGSKSWIKESSCTACKDQQQKCTQTCLSQNDPKISCDSANCQNLDQIKDKQRGFSGIESQFFGKIGSQQVLLPIMLVTKMKEKSQQFGFFNIFDSDSSFDWGFFEKGPKNTFQILNAKKLKEEDLIKKRQAKSSTNLRLKDSFFGTQQLKINQISLRHRQNNTFATINQNTGDVQLRLSLQTDSLLLPSKILKKLQDSIIQTYFANNSCKFLPGRLKCHDSLIMKDLFQTILQLKFKEFVISLPLQMLFTSCSKKQCICLLQQAQDDDSIVLGTIFWQIYAIQYNLPQKFITFMRKSSQWNDLFENQLINPQKIGFMMSLLLLVYHIFKYVFIGIFWLAVISILINCFVRRWDIYMWFKSIFNKNKATRVSEQDQQQTDYSKRKIAKLPSTLLDSQTL